VSEPVNLAYLIHHYGDAYEINIRRSRYEARRRDDGAMLTADSADALLGLIRADYASRPVPRSAGTAAPIHAPAGSCPRAEARGPGNPPLGAARSGRARRGEGREQGPPFFDQGGAATRHRRPALPAPGSASGGPPGAPAPSLPNYVAD
jgi:hypothetical protein